MGKVPNRRQQQQVPRSNAAGALLGSRQRSKLAAPDRDNRGQAIEDLRCATRILLTGVVWDGNMGSDILIKKAWDNHRVLGL